MERIKGWLEIVDDYGEHKYTVIKIEKGSYYFAEKNLYGNMLRYNEKRGMIEEAQPVTHFWDVWSAYIYQATFVRRLK